MAKVYAEQVKKAQTLVAGLNANFELVKSCCDITLEQVEALREEVSQKAALASRKLDEVKRNMMNAKRQIKSSFDPSKWVELGVLDKR